MLRITEKIGSGEFGDVAKGIWRCAEYAVEIAVKTLSGEQSYENRVKLLQEAAITSQFKHPNVVKLYGLVSDRKQVRFYFTPPAHSAWDSIIRCVSQDAT